MTYHESLQIDHYEPKNMLGSKGDHPDNLLLSCSNCNGRAGKSDYHPKHVYRTRLKDKKYTFKVLNPRNDNFFHFYKLDTNGEIFPKQGRNFQRAHDNILLMKLDRTHLKETRKDYFELLKMYNEVETALKKHKKETGLRTAKQTLISRIKKIELFFKVFEISLNRSIKRAKK